MKLGLIARADNGGLGSQTWELYKHLKPAKTLVVDIQGLTGYQNYFNRYPDGVRTIGFPTNGEIDTFLEGLDVVLTVETPYNYYLFDEARRRGIKTVLQYNYEFLDYLRHPEWPKPDLLLAPSSWHANEIAAKCKEWGCDWAYLPAPVNRELFPFKVKTQAKSFLHIAGHPAHEDRNGTELVYAAIPLVKSDVKFVIRSQERLRQFDNDYRVSVQDKEQPNYWEVFRDEDVLLLPRRYGGLSLQLNEALSSGMVALMPDIAPQNDFLQKSQLIPAHHQKVIMTRSEIDIYSINPSDLAAKIDEFAQMKTDLIKLHSYFADKLAQSISWKRLLPEYEELLWKPVKPKVH